VTALEDGAATRASDQDRLIGDLGTHIRLLSEKIEWVRRSAVTTVAEIGPQFADLHAEVAYLRGEVTRRRASEPQDTHGPVNWCTLSAEDAESLWPAMGHWVQEVLGGWCEVTRAQLPDCWALHRPALMQVSWLWTSHIDAYLPSSHPNQAAEWNTRRLDTALEKIIRAIRPSQCRAVADRPGEHLVNQMEDQQRRNRNPQQQQPYLISTHAAYPYAGHHSARYAAASVLTLPAGREILSPGRQVIHRPFWQPYFEAAMQADLTERRRHAQQ
jgi:hypothetical protein